MPTDQEIEVLIKLPKTISKRIPATGYKPEGNYRRCTLELDAAEMDEANFRVFIRQNKEFIENYSIGLRCSGNKKHLSSVTLIRYNGPHGETSRHEDGHYNKPHIHRTTAAGLLSGSCMPREHDRKITDRYASLEQAIVVFFKDIGVASYLTYFPEISQRGLFDGYQ